MELLIPIIIIVFVVLAVLGAKQRAERLAALRAFADTHEMRFTEQSDYSFDDRFPAFSELQSGDDRYAYNLMYGQWGELGFTGFDYHYETESTDSDGKTDTTSHYFSGVVLELPYHFKNLSIRPEGFFDKVSEFFGSDDIDFESAEFSRKFYVKAQEKKWAYDVIHARTMEFLLGRPGFKIQFVGRDVLVTGSGVFDPPEFGQAADVVHGIINLLPDYVLRELKSPSA